MNANSNVPKNTPASAMNRTKTQATKQFKNLKQSSITKKILMVLIIIFVVWLIVYWIRTAYSQKGDNSKYSPIVIGSPIDAWKPRNPIKVPPPPEGLALSISTWFYMKNFEYNFGKFKNILLLGPPQTKDSSSISYPGIYFYPLTNSLKFVTSTTAKPMNESCDIKNVPLNKWVHVVYVLNNRTVDIYIDGKLERSCVLQGLPKIGNKIQLNFALGKEPGFYGKIGRSQYFARAIEPNEVSGIYAKGPLGSVKYKVNFFVDGDIVKTESLNNYGN